MKRYLLLTVLMAIIAVLGMARPSASPVIPSLADGEGIASEFESAASEERSLPFRVGEETDGLPGLVAPYGGYVWESPLYKMDKEISAFRLTVFKTNNGALFGNTEFPSLGELELYDADGNEIELTASSFKTNSVNPQDGMGLAGLCDNDYATYYHAAWGAGQDPNGFDGSDYVYIEVTLPYPISAFSYKQYGRYYFNAGAERRVNTPTDIVFGEVGVDVTPDMVPFTDSNNAVLGQKITDVSQITDDGLYVLQGLYNCDPVNYFEGGPLEPVFYKGTNVYGKHLNSSCAFSIASAGDGKYTIQSLADGKYWSKEIDDDGWASATSTLFRSQAAHVTIESRKNDGLPGSFVIYHYMDSIVRNGDSCPYVVFQDWGRVLGYFAIPDLSLNQRDGKGEWYIYKMTMDTPYVYWLANLVNTVNQLGYDVGNDPGYYKIEGYAQMIAAAQRAIELKQDDVCKNYIDKVYEKIDIFEDLTPNPIVEGEYVIESALDAFYATQGVRKMLFVFPEGNDEGEIIGYHPAWGNPQDTVFENLNNQFKFRLESAAKSQKVAEWLEAGVITAEQALNAYYIKNLMYNRYIGAEIRVSTHLSTTEEAEAVYIFRQQKPTVFDIWNPDGANFSIHAENHSDGAGTGGRIVYWEGVNSEASQWRLRSLAAEEPSIYSITVEAENGTVTGAGEYEAGSYASLVAVPDTGYVFAGWYSGGTLLSIEAEYSFKVEASMTITARFTKQLINDNTMKINSLVTFPGSTLVIPVEMDNVQEITAFQFDIYLPDGITIAINEDDEPMIELASGRKTSTHSITSSQLPDGGIRIVSYSSSSKPFRGTEGALVNITTNVSSALALGDYTLIMKNMRLSAPDASEYITDYASSVISVSVMRGDVNMDKSVSMSDVVATVNYILQKPVATFNLMAADITGDGDVSMADVVGIVNIVLNPETEYSRRYNIKRGAVANSGDCLTMSEVRTGGASAAIPLNLANCTAYTAFQMDVELPEGATMAAAYLSERASGSHTVAWNTLDNGKVRVVAYSVDNSGFAGNSGELVTLEVEAAEGASGTVKVENVRMVTSGGVENAINGCGSIVDINGTTGIATTDSGMFRVYASDGALVVESGKEMQLPVYSANGRLVKMLDVAAGKNVYDALPAGVYVANGIKVILK